MYAKTIMALWIMQRVHGVRARPLSLALPYGVPPYIRSSNCDKRGAANKRPDMGG
jgi:hypothetical protein